VLLDGQCAKPLEGGALDFGASAMAASAQCIYAADFAPAMKFARREGAQLFLVTLGPEMREHADLVIDEYPLRCAMPARCGLRYDEYKAY
jgi:hypothetical protein